MTDRVPSSHDAREQEGPLTAPPSNRWILLGSLAMMLGLIMGFIMSSLGK
ncbi:MAG: hypothetical protein QM784_16345 [Polyangiaceae bacterium]